VAVPTTERDSNEVIVLPPAVVDLSTVEVLARNLERACALGPERVVVDFSGVSFSDVTVVDALLQAADRLQQNGCDLQVRHPDRFLTRVADVLGLRSKLGLTTAA
jgi:anti-anti-sigma factor